MMQAETASMSFAARERSPCSMPAAAALVLASVGADLVLPGWMVSLRGLPRLNPVAHAMESTSESKALVPAESRPLIGVAGHHGIVVPRVIAEAGEKLAANFP
jgi:hypothetical protein